MPRTKDYSEEVVLAKAMIAFWEAGMNGVTTRDLSKVMGINQYSVYASFISKKDLFAKALEYYYDKFIEKGMGRPLLADKLGIQNLQKFLNQFTVDNTDKFPRGCFICNTMVDDTNKDKKVKKVIERYQVFIMSAFEKIVQSQHPEKDTAFIKNKTQILYGSLLGLIVRKRHGIEKEDVIGYIEQMMSIAR
ncbi:MAG: TetR/AcrR family transcriptional regulator [Leptospirales bacterium]